MTKLMLALQLLAATLFAVILQTSENRIRCKTLLFRARFSLGLLSNPDYRGDMSYGQSVGFTGLHGTIPEMIHPYTTTNV
jgi:hypothetical protein